MCLPFAFQVWFRDELEYLRTGFHFLGTSLPVVSYASGLQHVQHSVQKLGIFN
jgi:hypothetical protein